MNVHLMHADRDFDPTQEPPWGAPALLKDLDLETIVIAMAGADLFLIDVARAALLAGVTNDIETIRYRQQVLTDALGNASIVNDMYGLVVEAIAAERKHWWGASKRYPASTLYYTTDILRTFMATLRTLREIAEQHRHAFTSKGFTTLFDMFEAELADDYLERVSRHLADLEFRNGLLLSAELGSRNEGTHYILRESPDTRPGWLARIFNPGDSRLTFRIHPRDQSGARILSEMRDRGINLVANALGQSTEHILGFFRVLRTELAFYLGAVNLHRALSSKGLPMCIPAPFPASDRAWDFTGLYDASLALTLDRAPVGNAFRASHATLVVITGPNQGGKSAFLRGLGIAQLMMQAGLFVGAESFGASTCAALFTHYKREEDATMTSGKLDEELARISEIADHLVADAVVLFNESFAATNDHEGSEIARQIVQALLEREIRVLYVTHLYEFASHIFAHSERARFLRAERTDTGIRTFRMIEGQPLQTSYGEDLYRAIFQEDV